MPKKKLPAALLKSELYSDVEFRALNGKEHRQERLLAAVTDDRDDRLNDTDFRYLELLKKAYGILTGEFSPILAKKKIRKLLEVSSPARLKQIIDDVQEIFCNTDERSQALERTLMINRLSRLIDKREKKDIFDPSLDRLYKLLGEWKGLGKDAAINPDDFVLPEIVYSSDINDLPGSIEDIEHEEV